MPRAAAGLTLGVRDVADTRRSHEDQGRHDRRGRHGRPGHAAEARGRALVLVEAEPSSDGVSPKPIEVKPIEVRPVVVAEIGKEPVGGTPVIRRAGATKEPK